MATSHSTPLILVVVSEDWFARCLLESLAAETGAFAKIITVDDGYSALAETWQGVLDGAAPNVFLIDQHSVGPSGYRLVTELRMDPATANAFIAVLTADEPLTRTRIDLVSPCTPMQPEVPNLIELLATRARAAAAGTRAA